MSRLAFPLQQFVYPDNSPVANGTIVVRLSQDGSANDTQVSTQNIVIPLNSSGVITGTPNFWQNISIAPTGTYYILYVYNSIGTLVAGPNLVTV